MTYMRKPEGVRHADPILTALFDAIWADGRQAETIARKAGVSAPNLRNFMMGRTKTTALLNVTYLIPVVMPGHILAIIPDPEKAKPDV